MKLKITTGKKGIIQRRERKRLMNMKMKINIKIKRKKKIRKTIDNQKTKLR